MAAPAPSEITGLVLAGGRGSRMGGLDKGWVLHGGEPLVRHVLRRLAPQVGALLISANRTIDAYRSLADVVTDADAGIALEPFPGPLAGILAALRRTSTAWVAVVPCDAPALPADLVARLAASLGAADAACASVAGRRQPVFALVPRAAADSLQEFLLSGGRALHRWLDTLEAAEVEFEDENAFRNINSAADTAPSHPPPSA